jgi:hypothetical protein
MQILPLPVFVLCARLLMTRLRKTVLLRLSPTGSHFTAHQAAGRRQMLWLVLLSLQMHHGICCFAVVVVLQEFDGSGKGNPFMIVWGQTVLILHIVLVNILIMSLVIAVITNAYNPEMVKAQAIVMQAETTFQYDFHGEEFCRWLLGLLSVLWLVSAGCVC